MSNSITRAGLRLVPHARYLSTSSNNGMRVLNSTSKKTGMLFTQHSCHRRWYSSGPDGQDSGFYWERCSRIFYNYSAGISFAFTAASTGIAVYSAYTHVENKKKELMHVKELGLTNLIPLQERTLAIHSDFLAKTQRKLRLIGNSGNRIVAESLQGGKNPIRTTIVNLLEKGVEVQLIIYNPQQKEKLHLNDKAVGKIKDTIKVAKEIQDQFKNGKFQVRVVDEPPPFLGDIIDDEAAHVRRVPRKDPATASGTIEVYEKVSGDSNRMKDIVDDFDDIWSLAKDINK